MHRSLQRERRKVLLPWLEKIVGHEPREFAAWLDFTTLMQTLARNGEFLAGAYNLSYRGYISLLQLRANPQGINLSTLASLAGVKRPTMTGIAGVLQRNGMIELEEPEDDRRTIVSSITPKAIEVLEQILPRRKDQILGVFGQSSKPLIENPDGFTPLQSDEEESPGDPEIDALMLNVEASPEFEIWSWLTWIQRKASLELDLTLQQEGLPYNSWITLAYLAASRAPYGNGKLAALTIVSHPSMTSIINRLVRLGMAWRQRPLDDRRSVELRVTPEGSVAAEKHAHLVKKNLYSFFSVLEADFYQNLKQFFSEATNRLSEPDYY